MAWRDSRKNRKRLLLFMSSIVFGIAALVAINSFGDNMKEKIDMEARNLLGADLEVRSSETFNEELYRFFDSLNMQMTKAVNFASMVYFPSSEGTRLVHVHAVEPEYPFYGKLESVPAKASETFVKNKNALVGQTLLLQYNAEVGEKVKIGEVNLEIEGSLIKIPGQTSITTSIAPPVFIPLDKLHETGLIQMGSRINHVLYLKYPEGFDNQVFKNVIEPRLKELDLRYDDVAERKEELGDTFSDLTGFLNLTAFVALLLGCIGVASSVTIYMKEKVQTVAILCCLGAQGKDGVGIFLIQILTIGLIGSVIGAVLGIVMQFFLPNLLVGFLPFEVDVFPSWPSIFQGVVVGVVVSGLFALLPLMQIRKVSPLKALRTSFENPEKDKISGFIYSLFTLFVLLFSWLQLRDFLEAVIFTTTLLLAAVVLSAVAKLVIFLLRKYFPAKSSFIWRQGLSNLFRPNNQTSVLIITIGLGTALVATLFLSQGMLLDKVKFSAKEEGRPNMVLFDVQTSQLDSVISETKKHNLSIVREVPVVAMKMHSLRGQNVEVLKKDTTDKIENWVLRREYRVTYRDSLIDSETIAEGKWQPQAGDSIMISISEGMAEDMDARIGDPISFNVQGAIIDGYIGSIRKIDWQRVQTNFMVVFPSGVLEKAPKFHVILTRFDTKEQSANFQQEMVQVFPNISIIDLNLILETLEGVLSQVSFVIRFIAFFSIITGLIVLIGSVRISKIQRLFESVLLRTMGANRKQIVRINLVEYFLLGSLASLTGIIIALLSTWALAIFQFDTLFIPDVLPLLITYLSITALTVIIGMGNSRELLKKPPLEVLRG